MVRWSFAVCAVSVLAGCDSASPGDGGGGGAASTNTAADTSSSAAPSMDPQAPQLDTVGALHGALHVFWTNVTTDCDAIEIERKTEMMPTFAPLLSVAGDIEDQADDSATNYDMVYTYRLRCQRDGVFSPYSDEGSRKPKPEE